MSEHKDAAPPGVIRTERVEVVDDKDRVRVTIGRLPTPSPSDTPYGLAIYDESGQERAWLAVSKNGPALSFAFDGNGVAALGINDPADDSLLPGAYLWLADAAGTPAYGASVDLDGTVEIVGDDYDDDAGA